MLQEFWAQLTVLQIGTAVLSFLAGFLVRGFTYTAKERADVQQRNFVNARELAGLQQDRFNELSVALEAYAAEKGKPTVKDFAAISRAAQNYLYQQQITADAILSDKVDAVSRDNTLMPRLIDTAEKTIPKLYVTLHDIAKANDLIYPIEFKRENYESIYAAVEKFGALGPRDAKLPVANTRPARA
ncbi:MAG: hypothetical protein WBR13_03095 [Allosphingosinicella sp.]